MIPPSAIDDFAKCFIEMRERSIEEARAELDIEYKSWRVEARVLYTEPWGVEDYREALGWK